MMYPQNEVNVVIDSVSSEVFGLAVVLWSKYFNGAFVHCNGDFDLGERLVKKIKWLWDIVQWLTSIKLCV